MSTPYLIQGDAAVVGYFPISRLLKSAMNYQKHPSNIAGNVNDLGVAPLIQKLNQAVKASKTPDSPPDFRSFGNG